MFLLAVAGASLNATGAPACPVACGECPPPGYNQGCCVGGSTCSLSPNDKRECEATAGNVFCASSDPLPFNVCPSWSLEHAGYCYAVMDRHPYRTYKWTPDPWASQVPSNITCQMVFLQMPLGWEVAPTCMGNEISSVLSSRNFTEEEGKVASYAWNTDYLVYGDGSLSATWSAPSHGYRCGQPDPGVLESNGTAYRINNCCTSSCMGKKVVMRKPLG
jgi:hypothetical protein